MYLKYTSQLTCLIFAVFFILCSTYALKVVDAAREPLQTEIPAVNDENLPNQNVRPDSKGETGSHNLYGNLFSEKLSGLNDKIALDLKNMDVLEVIKFLSIKGHLNITAGNDVSGRVTLFMTDITIRDALDIIMFNNNLGYIVKEGVIFIMSDAKYRKLEGRGFSENRVMKVLALKYSSIKDISAMLSELKSDSGKILMNSSTKVIVLIDTPPIVRKMENTVMEIEGSLKVVQKVYKLNYSTIEEIEPALKEALTPDIGKIRVDKRTNSIIIKDLPENFKNIKTIVKLFDSKPKQVLIEARIVEVTLKDSFSMGIDWQNLLSSTHSLDLVGSFPVSSAITTVSQKLSIGSIPDSDFQATMTLLKTIGQTEILSTPRITTISNKEASILVGTKDAYLESTVAIGTTASTSSTVPKFIEVGIKLHVTPIVSEDDHISLNIKPEVSSVIDRLENSTIPIVSTTEAETNVVIKNGATVIIGGLIKESDSEEESKMPLLGDIPLLGALFRTSKEENSKTELVIFITATIVDGSGNVVKREAKLSKPLKGNEVISVGKPSKPRKN